MDGHSLALQTDMFWVFPLKDNLSKILKLISVFERADALYMWIYYTADKPTAFVYLLNLWNLLGKCKYSWEFVSTFFGKADNFCRWYLTILKVPGKWKYKSPDITKCESKQENS